jgi:hypothetical protein
MEILNNLEPLLKTFWFVAIPVSLIFIIQSIMTFVGGDATDGIGADFESDTGGVDDHFQVFSLRNLVNFLLGFSWTGISFYTTISNKPILMIIALLVGALYVYLFFIIIKQVQNLSEDNSFRFSNTINKSGEVLLTIPGNKSGKGKVLMSVNGAYHELDAMTDQDKLVSGTLVKVVKVEFDNILIVETI